MPILLATPVIGLATGGMRPTKVAGPSVISVFALYRHAFASNQIATILAKSVGSDRNP